MVLKNLVIGGILVVLVISPFFSYPVILMYTLCFALFACSFNLLFGYAGLLSFGHMAFFGSAAYVTGYSVKEWGITPEVGILLGVVTGAALGLIFGFIALRRRGIYFAMITLGLGEIIYFLANQLPFTGGENGLQQIPRGYFLGFLDLNNQYAMYYFVLIIMSGGFYAYYRIIYSPFGQILLAIRENEIRVRSLGYNVQRFKLLAFVLSAALAALAGATKCLVFQFATLTDVFWFTGAEPILMTLLGGLGTVLGPVVGAFILVPVQSYFAEAGEWVTIINGSVLVAVILLMRRGIVGELSELTRKLRMVLQKKIGTSFKPEGGGRIHHTWLESDRG